MNPAPVSDRTARTIRRVAELMAGAEALLITAGAGMSADSGLPVFRGNEGFWRAYPPLAAQLISFERMAQPDWFVDRPRMAWAFYGHRQQLYREALPHPGYAILRQWAARATAGSFVATSNVDGQFFKAGFALDAVTERHGSIHRLQCQAPCTQETWEASVADLDIDLASLEARGELPRCPHCGAVARPNILMFNDTNWVSDVMQQQNRAFDAWLARTRGRRLVILEIGAGSAIPTIRRIGERAAQRPRTTLIRINPEEREGEDDVIVLPLPALQALTLVDQVLCSRLSTRATAEAAALQPVPAREMPLVDPPDEAASRAAIATRTRRAAGTGLLDAVNYVDLRSGLAEVIDPGVLSAAEIEYLLAHWYGASKGRYMPVPALRGISLPGYTMRGRVVASPELENGGTPGAALLEIRDASNRPVASIGIGRRPLESSYLWRRLIEGAKAPVQAVEYPREPWIARLLQPGAARNAAMLGSLCPVEYAVAIAWLSQQERS